MKLKRLSKVLLALVGLILVVFWLGPRPVVDDTIRPISIGRDLDNYLREQESRFDDITPGIEKQIIWVDSDRKERTRYSIIYLNGFAATSKETRPMADRLAEAIGANLYYPRLRGHGRPSFALKGLTVNDWLNDAVESLMIGKRIGEEVIIVSVSTGGCLANWLCHYEASSIAAAVLISPNFSPQDKNAEMLTWPWACELLPLIFGQEFSWDPGDSEVSKYWTTSYDFSALCQMMAMVAFSRNLNHEDNQTPTLYVLSRKDEVIDPAAAEEVFNQIGSQSKKWIWFDESEDPQNHVLAGDIKSPATTDSLVDLIRDFLEESVFSSAN